jgi:CRISPR-associated protein Cas2
MRCLLVYDIPDDAKRTRIADICLDYGLDRAQFSVFSGVLTQSQQDELMLKLKRTLAGRPGKLMLLPICATDWGGRREHIVSETQNLRNKDEKHNAVIDADDDRI